LNKLDYFSYLVAVGWFFSFTMVGDFFPSELALLIFLFFQILVKGRLLLQPVPKTILLLGVAWLISQVVTDLYVSSPESNFLRGWAAIVFFLIDFAALYLLLHNNEKRLIGFIWFYTLGGIFKVLYSPYPGFEGEPWKFGYGLSVSTFVILSLVWAIKRKWITSLQVLLAMLVLGTLSAYLNSRSLAGMIVISGMVYFAANKPTFKKVILGKMNPVRLLMLVVFSCTVIYSVLLAYQWLGESGELSKDAQHKYDMNKSDTLGVFGIVLSGRSEFMASIPAIVDSPILGHGSWAEDQKYADFLLNINEMLGTARNESEIARSVKMSTLIPAHSHVLQAWVWAGVLGAVFWIYLLSLVLRSLWYSLRFPNWMLLLVLFVGIRAIWDWAFSPFGSLMRLTWAWEIMLMITVYEMGLAHKRIAQTKSNQGIVINRSVRSRFTPPVSMP